MKRIFDVFVNYKMPTTFSEWAFQVTFAFGIMWIFIGLGFVYIIIFN